ncbi:DNA mismatch repair endonuclease MutL [Acetivibrio saccincola]|uniref:DNA mismatch repair endonuclease MutL n=1 Tax=Acetivibrio saccincola TaxID=1677857 RepID=UPI002BA2BA45|nr:DNA mismatch repair endonuclease MutL [Acetivibrio saccincola]HQD29462.1 DNA mismatch repair endonuclease MutL [Acetivibrio saccincola]
MGQIVILDENTSNQIAAGEVVENPASVVKELVENSIDAGSTNITVEIQKGGITFIKVIDNGCGMEEDDVLIAFERHATSKIRSSNDLEGILTLGFRGEALASIASVSVVELTTRTKDKPYGSYVRVKGGTVEEVREAGCPVGTTFVVRDLFFNTPARFKFLKKDSTEAGYISDILNRIALGNPHISFKLVNNKKTVVHTPGNKDLLSTIFSIYGRETAKECIKITYKDEMFEIEGYAGKPSIARSNRNWQSIYINGRYIKNKTITAAIDEAYKTSLMKNKFPFVVLNIKINPVLVDVNVHPTKMEVRFTNEQDVFRAVYYAINNALLNESLVKNIEIESKDNIFKYEINSKKDEYIQERIGNIKSGSQMSKPEKAESKITGCETAELKEAEINEGEPKAEEKRKSVSETIELKSAKIKETESIAKLKITEPEITETKITKHEAAEPEIIKPEIAEPEAAKHEIAESKREKNEITEPKAVKHGITETETVKNEIAGIEAAKPIKAKQKASGPLLKEEPQGVEDITLEAKEDIFTDYRIIGQVFSTYIILQKGENLVLIDQHAAHERIVFEELKEKYYKEENLAQYLLEPVVIELTSQEAEFINDKSEMLNKLGFITENFGDNSIILRSVPANSEGGSIREAFLDVLDFLMSENKKDNVYIAEEVLYKMACKGAVKANEKLGDIEIRNIIKKLSQLKNPYTCPHGRPTIIKITKYELEKMFKRIV